MEQANICLVVDETESPISLLYTITFRPEYFEDFLQSLNYMVGLELLVL